MHPCVAIPALFGAPRGPWGPHGRPMGPQEAPWAPHGSPWGPWGPLGPMGPFVGRSSGQLREAPFRDGLRCGVVPKGGAVGPPGVRHPGPRQAAGRPRPGQPLGPGPPIPGPGPGPSHPWARALPSLGLGPGPSHPWAHGPWALPSLGPGPSHPWALGPGPSHPWALGLGPRAQNCYFRSFFSKTTNSNHPVAIKTIRSQ